MTSELEQLLRKLLAEERSKRKATVDNPLLTTKEVGLIIGRHPKAVLQLVAERKIGCIRQDPHAGIQFTQQHVDDYLATCEIPAGSGVEPQPTRNPKYANR